MSKCNPTSPGEARIRAEIAAKRKPFPPHGASTMVVSIEAFFDGNANASSIAVHVVPHPGLDVMCALLLGIRNRADVADVLVEVSDEEPMESWPFSECLYVLTSAMPDVVATWLAAIGPTSVTNVAWADVEHEPGFPQGAREVRVVKVWWD